MQCKTLDDIVLLQSIHVDGRARSFHVTFLSSQLSVVYLSSMQVSRPLGVKKINNFSVKNEMFF